MLAGAGSGKTKTVVSRVIHLIKDGVAPERILLLTFTRRAAREMQDRMKSEIGDDSRKVLAGTFHSFALNVMKRMPKAFGLA